MTARPSEPPVPYLEGLAGRTRVPLAGIEPALSALEAAALPSDSRGVNVMVSGPGGGRHRHQDPHVMPSGVRSGHATERR
jgi:hypothetical protein